MQQTLINSPQHNTTLHPYFDANLNILQIIYGQEDSTEYKKFELTDENCSYEVKLIFKQLKNFDIFLKQNPESLRITDENILKLHFQCFFGKNLSTILEFCLFCDDKHTISNKTQKIEYEENAQIKNLESKVTKLQKQHQEKNKQIQKLQNRILQFEKKLQFQQIHTLNQGKTSGCQQLPIKKEQEKEFQFWTGIEDMFLNVKSVPEKRSLRSPSMCKSENQSSKDESNPSIKGIRHTKSTIGKQQEGSTKQVRKMSSHFLSTSTPIRMKLLINQMKIQQFFAITECGGLNKRIQKVNGDNIGHQIVFQNWIYKEGCSYFRFQNRGVKDSLLYVGVILSNLKNQKLTYLEKECVSYNCSNSVIWSQGRSHQNSITKRQFRKGQIITVLVNNSQKTIQWYVNQKIVALANIQHLFEEQYKQLRLHPFIGMENIGGKVDVINDQSLVPQKINIQKLIGSEDNKSWIEKQKSRVKNLFIDLPNLRQRVGSAYQQKKVLFNL